MNEQTLYFLKNLETGENTVIVGCSDINQVPTILNEHGITEADGRLILIDIDVTRILNGGPRVGQTEDALRAQVVGDPDADQRLLDLCEVLVRNLLVSDLDKLTESAAIDLEDQAYDVAQLFEARRKYS